MRRRFSASSPCTAAILTLAVAATTNKCFRNAAFTTPTSHNPPNVRLTLCRCTIDSKAVGGDVFSVTPSNKSDVDYLGEGTKGDLNVKLEQLEAFGIDGHAAFEGPIEEVARTIPGAVDLLLLLTYSFSTLLNFLA
ncbi:putative 5-nucleotidase domain-containing protein 4 [Sesbania bispinosa]|nr:putative 5-nucleotidase domain-containing protein 4 [Sesbania bispinosa]